jgi:hypothetical protein
VMEQGAWARKRVWKTYSLAWTVAGSWWRF